MTVPTQQIGFPGSSVPLSEVLSMLSEVSQDARKATRASDRNDLESLRNWLEETINTHLAGVK